MKLSKVALGWYASADGTWAVVGDAPGEAVTLEEADGDGVGCGCSTLREWQVLHDAQGRLRSSSNEGTNRAWVGTLREGREAVDQFVSLEGNRGSY